MNKLKSYLFHKLTSKVFKLPKLISIQVENGVVMMNGQEAQPKQVQDIVSDAVYLQDSIVFNALLNDLKAKAEEDIYVRARNAEDLLFPKATLYIINYLVNSVEGYKSLDKTDTQTTIEDISSSFTIS